jgi:acetyl esterase/lipase
VPIFGRLSLLITLAAAAIAQPNPDSIAWEKQVVYNGGGRLAMDLAIPKTPGPHPAVVAIHGGGFQSGDRSSYADLAARLARHGYVAASIDYRLAPASQFPAALQDVKAAIRFLRANASKYSLDPDRIAALGDSAGATLALLAALTPGVPEFESGGPNREFSARISCVAAFSPISDLSAIAAQNSETTAIPAFLGGSFQNSRAAYLAASPLHWTTPQAPPVLAIHGAKDDVVPLSQSTQLVDRLRSSGAIAELVTIDGGGHDLQLSPGAIEQRLFAFLDEHLGLTSPRQIVLVADHGGKGQVAAIEWPSGRELWSVPNRGGHDVQPLPGGRVLYTLGPDRKVVEMDSSHNPVWTYGPDEGLQHPISAQRLPNGNTLIGDAQLGKVIELDANRKVVWTYASPDLANMRMRNSRRIANGNTLISIEAAGKIIEVNPSGEIVWTYAAEGGPKRRPYKGYRLPNGNTLITLTSPGELVEVDRAGHIVRSIAGEKNDIRMIWASGFDLLPNGNILLNDYLGHRIVELDAEGKVLHEVRFNGRNIASIALVK